LIERAGPGSRATFRAIGSVDSIAGVTAAAAYSYTQCPAGVGLVQEDLALERPTPCVQAASEILETASMSKSAIILILGGCLVLATTLSSPLQAGVNLSTPVLSAQPRSSGPVFLSWSDPDNRLSGFHIGRSSTSATSGFTVIAAVSGKSTSYTDSGLPGGKTFYYRIQAYKQSSTSPYSAVVSATTVILAAPTGLVASAVACNQTNLSWGASSSTNLKGYNIYRNGAFDRQVLAPTTSGSDTAVTASTSYTYAVSAVDQSGNESPQSSPASAVTPSCPPPAAPTALTAVAASCQRVALSWIASTGVNAIQSYNVYRNAVLIQQVAGASTGATDSTASASTSYSYTVTAVDTAGSVSGASNAASVTTPACVDTTPPTVPTGLTVTSASCSQINLSWNASTDPDSPVKGYNIYRNGAFNEQVLAPATAAANTGLAASTRYSYTVTAIDGAGNESAASTAASATTNVCSSSGPVTNTFIDSGTLGESSLIGVRGRMAEVGEWQALLYDQGYAYDKYLYIRDDIGNTSWVWLPDLTGDMIFKAEYFFTSNTEFWVFSSNGMDSFGWPGAPAVARQYAFQGSPLPTAATLVSKVSFGDSYSAAGSFIKLKSGGFVGLWFRPNPSPTTDPSTNWVDLGFAYRSPTGTWSSIFPVRVDGLPGHAHSLALAQHPGDDSIWAFSKGDSFTTIWAIHLTETASGLRLDSTNSNFITQTADGPNGPEGELPYLTAVPDPSRNAIQLAYQNDQYKIFSTSPFVKGAFVSIAQISASAAKTFLTFPVYVERISALGLIAMPDKIWLGYRPINTSSLHYTDVYAASYTNGAWTTPAFLGTTGATVRNMLAYGVNRISFGLGLSDWTVHLYDIN